MNSFPIVHFEIFGGCNAKCPYCVTGAKNQSKGGLVNVNVFSSVIEKILEYGLFDRGKSVLNLYNWGEPFLHPNFQEIVSVINQFNIKYAISTNASKIPHIHEGTMRNLNVVRFSMPGFSQESYDKIHGFSFEKIKQNISLIVNELRSHKYTGRFVILYHIYQFNLHEMKECESFADSIGAIYRPYYAGINDWWQIQSLLNNTIPVKDLIKMSKDLFLHYFWQKIEESPKSQCNYLDQYLMIDEFANVNTCCSLPTNHPDYLCGNILTDDIKQIMKNKVTKPVCTWCIESGLSNYLTNTSLPDFYQFNNKQRDSKKWQSLWPIRPLIERIR